MKIVAVVVDHWVDKRVLFDSVAAAERYIDRNDGASDGRYGLDVCDDSCPNCGIWLSREAWLPDLDDIYYCPECGEPDERR
jgi:hypothetical protein